MKIIIILVLTVIVGKYVYTEFSVAPAATFTSTYSSNVWLEGTGSLAAAELTAQSDTAPVMVYIYADWCQYCKKFEKEILHNAQFSGALASLVKVRINPDHDAGAKAFMQKNNVSGFPTVLVRHHNQTNFRVVPPYVKSGGRWVLSDTDDFLASLR